jgi:hypothetical protein
MLCRVISLWVPSNSGDSTETSLPPTGWNGSTNHEFRVHEETSDD